MRRVATGELDDAREFLLVNIIDTYCELSDEQNERYKRLIAREEYRKVQDLELTWADKLVLEGEEQAMVSGKRETLRRQLTQKFGPLPAPVTERVEAEESKGALDGWLERIPTLSSLEEMGLA